MKKLLLLLSFCTSFFASAQFGNEVKETSANRTTEDYFGYSVASHRQFSIVGAPQSDLHGLNTTASAGNGYAEIFELTFSGIQSVQQVQPALSTLKEQFGYDVAIFGNFAAVSAPLHSLDENDLDSLPFAGAVFMYENITGTWQFSEKLVPNDRDFVREFGHSIDMYEDYLVVGAPGDQVGLPGQPFLNYAGAVYVFQRNSSGSYQQIEKLVANQRESASFLGFSVSIDQDIIAAGAPFNELDMLDQNPLSYAGSVYIFDFDGTQWYQSQKIAAFDRTSGHAFGRAVAVNHSPRQLAVGTKQDESGLSTSTVEYNAGAVYVYTDNGFGFVNDAKLISPDRESKEAFGCSIDLDGNYLAVGGRLDQDNLAGNFEVDSAGAVYLYNASSSLWTFTQKIISSDREAGDHFGQDVALNAFDTLGVTSYGLVVGAWKEDQDDQGGNYLERSGSAYFYGNTAIGLEDQEISSILVFPNPTKNQITVTGLQKNERVTLYNSLGQIHLQSSAASSEMTFDLTQIPTGLYTLKIEGSKAVQMQQIVKQ